MSQQEEGRLPANREDLERRIREAGAVLNMPFAQSIYQPLLATQPRDGVELTRDVAYGTDTRHRLDVYAQETAPIAQVYADRGLLAQVDGIGDVDDVTERLVAAIGATTAG